MIDFTFYWKEAQKLGRQELLTHSLRPKITTDRFLSIPFKVFKNFAHRLHPIAGKRTIFYSLQCVARMELETKTNKNIMKISPLAGKPAAPEMLVDVAKLVTAYYTNGPDPAVPAQRVAFGTSGHRGTAFKRSFNEDHILAITQAICLYRKQQGTNGRCIWALIPTRCRFRLMQPRWRCWPPMASR